jgi:hypothetical protein
MREGGAKSRTENAPDRAPSHHDHKSQQIVPMSERGKKSHAALELATVTALPLTERVNAPDDLTDAEKLEWNKIVKSKPNEWFTDGDAPILADYCRNIVRANTLAKVINSYKTVPRGKKYTAYSRLLNDSKGISSTLKSAATALRLTQQSRYTPKAGGTATKNPQKQPWER